MPREQANELIYKRIDRTPSWRTASISRQRQLPPKPPLPAAAPVHRRRPASVRRPASNGGRSPVYKGHRRRRHPLDARLTLVLRLPLPPIAACCGGYYGGPCQTLIGQVHQVFELPSR